MEITVIMIDIIENLSVDVKFSSFFLLLLIVDGRYANGAKIIKNYSNTTGGGIQQRSITFSVIEKLLVSNDTLL